jgi:hypothetical protein
MWESTRNVENEKCYNLIGHKPKYLADSQTLIKNDKNDVEKAPGGSIYKQENGLLTCFTL